MANDKEKKLRIHPTRIFKSPEDLEKAWNEFKEDIKQQANEWIKVQYVGKDGDRREEPQKVPLTLEGFEIWCKTRYGCVEQYFKNQDDYYLDFIPICSYIKKEIRNNQIIGGMLGFYNPSITQRLNNLVEKTDNQNNNTNTTTVINLGSGVNPELENE